VLKYDGIFMLYYKTFSSPLGKITLVSTHKYIVALYLANEAMPKKMAAKKNNTHKILLDAETQLKEYFSGKRKLFSIPLSPEGTIFQQKAWHALSQIPFGKVWSYGEQAQYLYSPNAQRAVGGANGKNPIPILIPCHRVIGSTGKLTGFSGGMSMKIFLLKLEGHKIDSHALKLL
jgi:methylated-DNA-[protein]-cysteine S-methyltransferase